MSFESIRRIIATAAKHEKRTGALAGMVRQTARAGGLKPTDSDVAAFVDGVRGYVESVPIIMEAMQTAARQAGIEPTIAPFVDFVTGYFENPVDVIPDRAGLWGILDDAYLALSVVQAVSESVRATTGSPLIPVDLSQYNLTARGLLGDQIGTQLDTLVTRAQASSILAGFASLLGQNPGAYGQYVNDPIWGNTSIQERVNLELGAMGIF